MLTAYVKRQFSDELRSNVSQMIQDVLMQILDSAVIDEDIAFPLLTALVKTDAKAADNRYAGYFTLLPYFSMRFRN